jgi:hypothetical protein
MTDNQTTENRLVFASGDMRAPIFYDYSNTGYYWDPNTSSAHRLQTPSGYLDLGPMNTGFCHFQTDRATFYFNRNIDVDGQFRIYGDTTNRFYQGGLVLRGSSPTIYFRDTNQNSAMVHVNSNIFYVLRGGNDSESWSTVGSGWWPLEINLTNNNASFGGNITAANDVYALRYYDRNDTAYWVDPHDESRQRRVRVGPYAGSTSNGNQTGLELVNNGGTGDGNVAAMSFHCSSQYGVHLHLRADSYFGLGGWSASSWRWYVQASTGNMSAAGEITAYVSDGRLKKNVVTIDNALEKLKQIRGVYYDWDEKVEELGFFPTNKHDIGVIAQEVEKVIPQAIKPAPFDMGENGGSKSGENYKTVQQDKIIPLLIQSVKEQQAIIEKLQKDIEELKSVNKFSIVEFVKNLFKKVLGK